MKKKGLFKEGDLPITRGGPHIIFPIGTIGFGGGSMVSRWIEIHVDPSLIHFEKP